MSIISISSSAAAASRARLRAKRRGASPFKEIPMTDPAQDANEPAHRRSKSGLYVAILFMAGLVLLVALNMK